MLIHASRVTCREPRIRFLYTTCVFLFQLSEMTADFAEEHSTSTLAAERIDAETSERLRLERELQDVTEANKNLQQTTERLEMELLYARAADLNGVASDGEEGEDGGIYRQRYEHAIRELEFTKRKMAQQHEDDLEQLVGLKKQLEKKVHQGYSFHHDEHHIHHCILVLPSSWPMLTKKWRSKDKSSDSGSDEFRN